MLIGSTLFQYFLEHNYMVERTTLYMIAVSCCSLLLAALVESHTVRLACFCVFEGCVGLFWPSLGFLRSKYVPEDCRATTMNFFRVPLNIIVVAVLANIGSLSTFQVFMLCVIVMMPALACQLALLRLVIRGGEVTSASVATGAGAGKASSGKPGDEVPLVRKDGLRPVRSPNALQGTVATPRRAAGSTPTATWPSDPRQFPTSP